MGFQLALAALITGFLLTWEVIKLARNISRARATGFPYTVTPVHELEVSAFLTDVLLRWYCREYLMRGQGWPKWARFMVKDWHYEDKGQAHREYGPVFLVVSAGGIVCYTADAEVSLDMVTRRKAFVKMADKMKMLEPFGPNVVSTEGDIWRSHIRITLPSFGEQVHNVVWNETARQADMLCQSWVDAGRIDIKDSIYQLTMNTMCLASFGWKVDWASGQSSIPYGHEMSLVDAVTKLVLHLPLVLLLPRWGLRKLLNKTVYLACCEFEKYMDELIAREKAVQNNTSLAEAGRENLLTALIRSNCESSGMADPHTSTGRGLTDVEIKGNIFIFLLAGNDTTCLVDPSRERPYLNADGKIGYDTTANTMIYACIVLALYPEIQDKAQAEVDNIYAEDVGNGKQGLSYSKSFHKFRYLVAVMYEVMRVFPTVLPITRQADSNQVVAMPGCPSKTALLPAGTICIVNITGTHFSQSNWPSPRIIEPRRWLAKEPNKFDPLNPSFTECEGSSLIPGHKRGTFMTFNEGPRACLGRKFARAEFLAFFSCLLRKYRLALDEGVSGPALEWSLRCRSGGSLVTLTPPQDIKLRLIPRSSNETHRAGEA